MTASDVLHVEAGHPNATIVGDLTCADHISSGNFDCVILTQTLQFIHDVPAVWQRFRGREVAELRAGQGRGSRGSSPTAREAVGLGPLRYLR